MSKDEHHVHLRTDKLRTMRRHWGLTGATQTNVNLLAVLIKSARTPLHVTTTAHLEVPIMSLSLPPLSAVVVNCATLAGSTLTKSPWNSEADLQHHFLWFNEILVLSLSCNFPLSTHTLGILLQDAPGNDGRQHSLSPARRERGACLPRPVHTGFEALNSAPVLSPVTRGCS